MPRRQAGAFFLLWGRQVRAAPPPHRLRVGKEPILGYDAPTQNPKQPLAEVPPLKDAIRLEYNLNEELWRRFFQAHYQKQVFFRLRHLYGALLVLAGTYLIGGPAANPWLGAAFLVSGLYCVLSQHLFIARSLATARKGPLFAARLTVDLSRDGVVVTAASQRSERPWSAFRGYRQVPPGIMLYLDRNAFFFIPREALTGTTAALLQRCLEQSGLRRL
jgi:YcxB-like protein